LQSGLLVLLLAGAWGCPDEEQPDEAAKEPKQDFTEIRLTDDADHFLYTYLLADGTFRTVERLEEVPEEAREQVIVIDTSLSPEDRLSSKIIYVADLTTRREDGTYPCRPVSRFKFERDLLRDPARSSDAMPPGCEKVTSPPDRVVLYVTSWCGVCKAAADFLRREDIPFVERDVEKDSQAQLELRCKALKTGTRLGGVPVLDIAGTLLVGFDRDDILRLARKLKAPAGPGSQRAPKPGSPPTRTP